MVMIRYKLAVAEPGAQSIDWHSSARAFSVDLASLGRSATVGDLKASIQASLGYPAAVSFGGPHLHTVEDDVGLNPYCSSQRNKFYLFAGQLYEHTIDRNSSLHSHTELAPLAAMSSFAGSTLLSALAFKLPPSCSSLNKFSVYVRTLTGKVITCQVDSATTVAELKEIVQGQEGIPTDQQRLIYEGKQLQDGCSMSGYRIDSEAAELTAEGKGWAPSVTLVLRLRAGMFHDTSGRQDNAHVVPQPRTHTEVTVGVPGSGELQLTVPVDVTGPELLQLVQRHAEAATADREYQWPLLPSWPW